MPGGFGGRGIEGKIRAVAGRARAAHPYLGICLGMQIAVCEFARHVAGMPGANSTEFDIETEWPVIDLLPEQKEVSDLGGTMRLGADPIKLHPDTRARELYGEAVIYERHRHRYEVSISLRKRLEAAGLVVSRHVAGRAPRRGDRAAAPEHPFFVASQYHPEFKSRPERPAPLFREFVGAAMQRAGAAGEHDPATARCRPAAAPAEHLRPASEVERRRLNDTFAELCAIASPSGAERAMAERVRGRAARRSASTSRRTARRPRPARSAATCSRASPAAPSAACCSARTSTRCPHAAPIEPVLVDGGWESAGDTILGADNKAAVAVLLELARRVVARGLAGRHRAAVHRQRGDARSPAPRRSTSRGCAASSATSSTTRRRSAR